jgi:hypothetical protein
MIRIDEHLTANLQRNAVHATLELQLRSFDRFLYAKTRLYLGLRFLRGVLIQDHPNPLSQEFIAHEDTLQASSYSLFALTWEQTSFSLP